MSYGEFVNFFGNAFGLFISTLGDWCDVLIHNYFFITILGTILFCSFVLFFKDFFVDLLSSLSYSLKKSSDEYVTNNFLYAEQNNSYILQELSSQSSNNYLQYNNINALANKTLQPISNDVDIIKDDVPVSSFDYDYHRASDGFTDEYVSPGMNVPPPIKEPDLYYVDKNFNSMERGVNVPDGGSDFYNGSLNGDDFDD